MVVTTIFTHSTGVEIIQGSKAIEINPNYALGFANRVSAKEQIGDMNGACNDWRKASSLGYKALPNR